MTRGFASNMLRNIADSEVDWIRLFATKKRNLSLVGGDDDRNYGSSRLVRLQFVLNNKV